MNDTKTSRNGSYGESLDSPQTESRQTESRQTASPEPPKAGWITVPNAICLVRAIGAVGLIPLATLERPTWFLIAYLMLASTDWLDGRLARLLNQRSRYGPKLDSIADVMMYIGLLFGAVWLFGDRLLAESLLIGAVVVSYFGACLASLLKFRELPSYHTMAAKFSWFLMVCAGAALFLEWSVWPLRFALFAVTATNVESMLITLTLRRRRENVPSIFHAHEQSSTAA